MTKIVTAQRGDWARAEWLARALSLDHSMICRWARQGKLQATLGAGPGRGAYCITIASVVAFLAKWSTTKAGSRHLARIGSLELARRRLIDESTRDRIDATRARKAIAALGSDELDE